MDSTGLVIDRGWHIRLTEDLIGAVFDRTSLTVELNKEDGRTCTTTALAH